MSCMNHNTEIMHVKAQGRYNYKPTDTLYAQGKITGLKGNEIIQIIKYVDSDN